MKKIVIFFLLAGCKFASFDNTETKEKSNMSRDLTGSLNNTPVLSQQLSQQELDKLWMSNLQSADVYYWDGISFSAKKTTVSSSGSFSTTNDKSVKEYYLIKANSSTEALYSYMFKNQYLGVIFCRTVLLNITNQDSDASLAHLYKETARATYISNNMPHLDSFQTDVLYRNP